MYGRGRASAPWQCCHRRFLTPALRTGHAPFVMHPALREPWRTQECASNPAGTARPRLARRNCSMRSSRQTLWVGRTRLGSRRIVERFRAGHRAKAGMENKCRCRPEGVRLHSGPIARLKMCGIMTVSLNGAALSDTSEKSLPTLNANKLPPGLPKPNLK
jgi:hypothetical protein